MFRRTVCWIYDNIFLEKYGETMYFQRLRDLREDSELKQVDIAKILGIQQTVYSRYERGVQNIPIEHLLTLADFYQTSTDYILGRTNRVNPPNKRI